MWPGLTFFSLNVSSLVARFCMASVTVAQALWRQPQWACIPSMKGYWRAYFKVPGCGRWKEKASSLSPVSRMLQENHSSVFSNLFAVTNYCIQSPLEPLRWWNIAQLVIFSGLCLPQCSVITTISFLSAALWAYIETAKFLCRSLEPCLFLFRFPEALPGLFLVSKPYSFSHAY